MSYESLQDVELLNLDLRKISVRFRHEYLSQIPTGGYLNLARDVRTSLAARALYKILSTEDGMVDILQTSIAKDVVSRRVFRFKKAQDRRITSFLLRFKDDTTLAYWYTRTKHDFGIYNDFSRR